MFSSCCDIEMKKKRSEETGVGVVAVPLMMACCDNAYGARNAIDCNLLNREGFFVMIYVGTRNTFK